MAIIKCPECGHQISDKAPVCPSCGVEIAGKITKCQNCGEIYFNYQKLCPNCYVPNANMENIIGTEKPATHPEKIIPPVIPPVAKEPQMPVSQQRTVEPQQAPASPQRAVPPVVPPTPGNTNQGGTTPPPPPSAPKTKRSIIIFSFIFAVIVCGILYYFYDNANKNKEKEAYEFAMQSSDPMVLQSYLDTYKDADQAHIDSIQSHLTQIKQGDMDWTNALVSGSREALLAYIQKYPGSTHKKEVEYKIDSLDWVHAKNEDTADAYQAYLDAHADGTHIEEAENAMKKIKSRDLQPEEKQMISSLYRKFFMSINSHSSSDLTDTCEDILSSLLGKNSATKADVITFMEKLYKDNVANMIWSINNDYQIKKREVGDNEYEYQVQFSAKQALELTDGSKTEKLYKITSIVSPAGKISSFNMSKVDVGE